MILATESKRTDVGTVRSNEQQLMSLIIVVLLGLSSILGSLVWSLTTDYSRHMAVIVEDVRQLQMKLDAHIYAHSGVAADAGKVRMP